MEKDFVFTRDQLVKILGGVIGMYYEFLDTHGATDEQSRINAVNEIIEGLDSERELIAAGEMKRASLQVIKEDDNELLNVLKKVYDTMVVADEYLPDEGANAASWMDQFGLVQNTLVHHNVIEPDISENLIDGEIV